MVLRSAISQNRQQAYATALGINSGATVWGIAAAVGASALLAASETAFMALKLVGAAYMIWLGLAAVEVLPAAGCCRFGYRHAPGTPGRFPARFLGQGHRHESPEPQGRGFLHRDDSAVHSGRNCSSLDGHSLGRGAQPGGPAVVHRNNLRYTRCTEMAADTESGEDDGLSHRHGHDRIRHRSGLGDPVGLRPISSANGVLDLSEGAPALVRAVFWKGSIFPV